MASGFVPELTPQLRFPLEATELHRKRLDRVVDEATGTIDEKERTWLKRHRSVFFYNEKLGRIPAFILGSDQVLLNSIQTFHDIEPDKEHSTDAYVFVVDLFRNGSPWVPEPDLEVTLAQDTTSYVVFSCLDMLPIAVQNGYLASLNPFTFYTLGAVDRAVEAFDESARRQLSNDDCTNLLRVIGSSVIDLEYTRVITDSFNSSR